MTAATPDLFTLPKAELHLHIEGTLEPGLAFELADRNRITLPFDSVEQLASQYDFTNLQSFLDLYYATLDVLRTEDDFAELTRRYLQRATAQGVRHAEIFFDPQAHVSRGVPFEAVVDGICAALAEARRDSDVSGGLILCFLRDRPVDEAGQILTRALTRAESLIGVGLDSAEVGYPPSLFVDVFARARAAGLHTVAHAGEEGPASYIGEALDLLRVERIDHGIRAIDDPELTERLAREEIALTVCPLSNVRLRAVPDLAAHPLRRLLDAGVRVTVNSDDPAYFGGYIGDNFVAAQNALGLSAVDALRLAQNSVESAFAPLDRKVALLHEIDGWAEQAGVPLT